MADPPTQIAFVDTPGLHRPQNALGRTLQENAKAGLENSDVAVMLSDVDSATRAEDFLGRSADREVLSALQNYDGPVILAINKVDRVKDKNTLFPILQAAQTKREFAAIVPISARRKTNLEALLSEIRKHLPEGLQYPQELLTDRPEKFFVAEFIREAVMEQTQKEVPYSVAVAIDSFVEEGNLTRIAASIIVPKANHKGILIGKGGQRLKAIGTAARLQAEQMLQRKVFLELWVKVVEDWTNQPSRVRDLVQDET